jgi:hypothetical protein
MTTGDFWDLSNPFKPVGQFDPDDVINLPFDFAEWLASQSATYASHTITPASGLQAADAGVAGGVVLVTVQAAGSPALVAGQKYGVTCQVTASDGQKRSQTLYLKIREL